jgi:hypothetical protein
VLQRRTQTAAFWRDQFEITDEDVEFYHDLILNATEPLTTDQLAIHVIEEYQRREISRMESELSKGTIYQPSQPYEIGQTLVFPAMDFVVGEVLDKRAGKNPEHGDFQVITVQIKGEEGAREFAAGLKTPHRLNQSSNMGIADERGLLSAQEIYDLYHEEIEESILFALEEGEHANEFVQVDGHWLLSNQLAEIHIGHRNIAEALIEMQGQPMSANEILRELDMDPEIAQAMQMISLNHALGLDERFDKVGRGADHLWFLSRLEPDEAVNVPPLLIPRVPRYNRALLSVELLQLEWELDDEWGESAVGSDVPNVVPSTSCLLIYPHRRYGTIPLSSRTRSFFPEAKDGRSLVTLIDGRWGNRHQCWVVHEGRYVSGLKKWMDEHNLPVGAQITLERTNKANEIVIDFRPRRMKREWSRFAQVDPGKKNIKFEMNKVQITCEYDEHLIVSAEDEKALDQARLDLARQSPSVDELVAMVVPELTKLSPQGTAHAKTVYSAVNMFLRCPPGPVFYALISNRSFRDTGGGLFALA